MKTFFRLLLLSSLLPIFSSSPALADDKKDFRQLLEMIAQRTQSSALGCRETVLRRGSGNATYRIALRDGLAYEKAFMIDFLDAQGGHVRSTMIAYVGHNNFPLGSLDVSSEGSRTTYTHRFDGFLEDVTMVVVENGRPKEFAYLKINPQKITIYSLLCPL